MSPARAFDQPTQLKAPAAAAAPRAPIGSAGGPGSEGPVSALAHAAAAAAAMGRPMEVPNGPTAVAPAGRVLELPDPVTPGNLAAAMPHAVKLAQREGVREVRIRLWPPELGSILVRLRVSGTEVGARIEAERIDVRAMLDSMRSDLGRGMQEAGLKLVRLEVGPVRPNEAMPSWDTAIPASAAAPGGGIVAQDRPGQGPFAGNSGQSGGFAQGDPGPRGEHSTGGQTGKWQPESSPGSGRGSDRGEAGLGARGRAVIDAWA
jgi:hypothetical protein